MGIKDSPCLSVSLSLFLGNATDKWILMKLNTVVVYDMRMCMKEEYFGSEKYNGR